MCSSHQPHHANKGKMCLKNCLFISVWAIIILCQDVFVSVDLMRDVSIQVCAYFVFEVGG